MAGGRRLSRGGSAGALVGKQSTESDDESDFDDLMDDEDDEDDAVVPSGSGRSSKGGGSTQGGGRRRSSFGGARFANAEEQERVVSMYSNVIKLSSENKINDKNSWNLDLIDNMGKLIKNDSREQRGVNFQKASCTLDASVKIYSHRVDDTYSTSHRVLESFSRNQLTEEEEVDEENDDMDEVDGVPKAKKASRVGSRKRSGAATTIEKNVDNINAKEIENEAKIDPIFQTMSKLFDKGGVHGMLMYNLRCVPNMPGMALCTEGLPDPFTGEVTGEAATSGMNEAGHHGLSLAEIRAHIISGSGVAVAATAADPVDTAAVAAAADSEANGSGSVPSEDSPAVAAVVPDKLADLLDITAWVTEIGIGADELSSLDICPQFDAWRGTSGMSNSQAGMVDPVDFVCEQTPADDADADADAMDTDTEGGGDKGGKEEEDEKESSTVAAARSKSALRAGFYDVSCLPFQSWAAEARDLARMKRKTALLSATSSSSSSSMRNVLPDGTITQQQQQITDASPEEGVLGFAPQTQECHYNDNGDNHDDDDNEGATFDMAGDYDGGAGGDDDDDGMEAYMEQEGDDCDEDGNYIASERRKSMAPPAMMGAEGTGGNRQSSLMAMNGGRMSLLPGPLASGDGGSNRASMSPKPQGKIQWGAINGDTQVTTDDLVDNLAADEQEAEAMIDGLAAVAGMISAGGAAASEYAFFDVETVSKNNNWAGAKHWKWGMSKAKKAAADAAASTSDRSLRQRNNGGGEEDEHGDDDTAMAANDDEAAGASKAKPKKKASKKATGTTLDFATCLDKKAWAAESSFSPPKGRTDTTCMTAAAIEKATTEADEGELFLPKDEKVEAKDLCRLFSVREMVVPPVLLRDLVIPSSMQQGGGNAGARFARNKAAQGSDLVWKCSSPSDNTTAANGDGDGELGDEPLGDDVGDYGEGGGGGDDGYDDVDYDDDRFYVSGDSAAPAPADSNAVMEGADSSDTTTTTDGVPMATVSGSGSMSTNKGGSVFDIDQSKLIKLDRKVEKINIGYSVIPKKVNVKQLKIDIWDQVATLAGVEREGASSTNSSADDEEDENEAPPPQDFHATQSSTVVKKTTDTTMSFQSLVNSVAGSQKQKEVTLSFYFICLLHLANEKTLKITDDKDTLDELVISSDSVGR